MATKHTILRLPDVKARTGLARATIYLRMANGCFPRPISLGGRAVGWIEAEVDEWLDQQISASRGDSRQQKRGETTRVNRRVR